MNCYNCNLVNPNGATFCNHCGFKLVDQGKSCSECQRKNLPEEALFCPDCGTDLSGGNNARSEKKTAYHDDVIPNRLKVKYRVNLACRVMKDSLEMGRPPAGSILQLEFSKGIYWLEFISTEHPCDSLSFELKVDDSGGEKMENIDLLTIRNKRLAEIERERKKTEEAKRKEDELQKEKLRIEKERLRILDEKKNKEEEIIAEQKRKSEKQNLKIRELNKEERSAIRDLEDWNNSGYLMKLSRIWVNGDWLKDLDYNIYQFFEDHRPQKLLLQIPFYFLYIILLIYEILHYTVLQIVKLVAFPFSVKRKLSDWKSSLERSVRLRSSELKAFTQMHGG